MPSKEEVIKENEILLSKLESERQKGLALSNSIKQLSKSILDLGIPCEYKKEMEDMLNATMNEKEEALLVRSLLEKIKNSKRSRTEENSATTQPPKKKSDTDRKKESSSSLRAHSILQPPERNIRGDEPTKSTKKQLLRQRKP